MLKLQTLKFEDYYTIMTSYDFLIVPIPIICVIIIITIIVYLLIITIITVKPANINFTYYL